MAIKKWQQNGDKKWRKKMRIQNGEKKTIKMAKKRRKNGEKMAIKWR